MHRCVGFCGDAPCLGQSVNQSLGRFSGIEGKWARLSGGLLCCLNFDNATGPPMDDRGRFLRAKKFPLYYHLWSFSLGTLVLALAQGQGCPAPLPLMIQRQTATDCITCVSGSGPIPMPQGRHAFKGRPDEHRRAVCTESAWSACESLKICLASANI